MIKNSITSDSLNLSSFAMHALSGPATQEHLIVKAKTLATQNREKVVARLQEKLPQELFTSDLSLSRSLQKLAAGAVVVCAGQQPSLCGGTFLSLYKAATAVQLSTFLNSQGINAVPLFWNASEDHDFDEANRLYLPPKQNQLEPVSCALPLRLTAQSLSKTLISSEDNDYIRKIIVQQDQDINYIPEIGQSIGRWATKLMLALTKGTGLLVCEPEWFSDYLIPFRRKLTTNLSKLMGSLTKQTTELQNHRYPTPVHFDSTQESMLFIHSNNQRTKIKTNSLGEFQAGDENWNLSDFQTQIDKYPFAFTSSALSRPLAQQFLFPVVAQVSGPTESAYLAQLRELYELMDVPNPIIWPRSTCLLMREQERYLSDLLKIKTDDLLTETFPKKIKSSLEDAELLEQINTTLRTSLGELDKYKHKDTKGEFMSFRTEVYALWRNAQKKSSQLQKKQLKPKSQALHRLKHLIQPRGISQERAYGPFGYGLEANSDFFHLLCEKTNPFQTKRQLVQI